MLFFSFCFLFFSISIAEDVTNFYDEKVKSSNETVEFINRSINEKSKKLKTLSVLLSEIYISIGDDKVFLDFIFNNLISGGAIDISEIAVFNNGIYRFVNYNEAGTYKSKRKKISDFNDIVFMDGYYVSSDVYKSETTDDLSLFLLIPIDDGVGVFVEFSVETLFYYLDESGDYSFIINKNNNLMYHPNFERIGTKANNLDVFNAKINKHWNHYEYKGKKKRALVSNDNPFGWYVVYSVWEYQVYLIVVKKLSLLMFLIFLPFVFVIVNNKANLYKKDKLTSLLSRDCFTERVFDNKVKAVCLLDLDNFKQINDKYGHDVGDEAIILFSKSLRSAAKGSDIAYRWGGEEFLFIIKGENRDVYSILNELRKDVENIKVNGMPRFTVSIGFAYYDPSDDYKSIIKKSDLALYDAKKSGRNKVMQYKATSIDKDGLKKCRRC